MMRLLLVVLLAVTAFGARYDPPGTMSAVCDASRNCKIVEGWTADGAAYGNYEVTIEKTGWNILYIHTNRNFSDDIQAYAAGWLEGYLTHDDIYAEYVNEQISTSPAQVFDFVAENDAWVRTMVASNNSIYWQHVGLVLAQLDGMFNAHNNFSSHDQQLTLAEFILLSADGDLGTLQEMYTPSTGYNPMSQHCSSIVKVMDDFSDIFIGHTTWAPFNTMLRLYKYYTMDFNLQIASRAASFSSYAGSLTSIDDWFVLDSNIVVTETTNAEFNRSIYQYVTPKGGLLSWLRTVVANRMSPDGKTWVDTFSYQNSGTYNNQWIVLDFNLFTPGQNLLPNTLWIVEQAPGFLMSQDVTQILSYGYWPSYNVPYFEEMFNYLGYPSAVQQFGNALFSKDLCARAEIFRRDQDKVRSLDSFGKLLRYNDWQHDPLSEGNAGLQISSRFDLVTKTYPANSPLAKAAFGGIDSKITSSMLMKHLDCLAQSGPSHDVQPPFSWEAWPGVARINMPTVWNFTWEPMHFTQS